MDCVLVLLFDFDHEADRSDRLLLRIQAAAAKLHLAHPPDLDAGDLDRSARLQAARVFEVDVDRVRRLEAEPAHDHDEPPSRPERHQDQHAHFDLDRSLAHRSLPPWLFETPRSGIHRALRRAR